MLGGRSLGRSALIFEHLFEALCLAMNIGAFTISATRPPPMLMSDVPMAAKHGSAHGFSWRFYTLKSL